MKRGKGKISFSKGETNDGTKEQDFRKKEKFGNFRRGGWGRFKVRGRGRGYGRGVRRRFYHPIKSEDAKVVNKFLTGPGAPMGRGHFVYPDSYSESIDEETKHVSVFHQTLNNSKNKKKKTTVRESTNVKRQQEKLRQNYLRLFNIQKKYGLPNENHLVALEEYKGWNILNLFDLLNIVGSFTGHREKFIKKQIDKRWSKKGVETPASWVYDELLKHLEPPVLKESLDYAKLFLAKRCSKDIIQIVEEKPKRFPGIFLTGIQVWREEASRLLGEKIELTCKEFVSAVSPIVKNILWHISSEKVKKSWLSIADSFKDNPDLYPLKDKFIFPTPKKRKRIHTSSK